MIASRTKLQFDDFYIVQSSAKFIQPKNNEEIDIPAITSQYEIDLDYGFRRDSESIYLFIKVSINRVTEPKLGYQLFCEGVGVLNAELIKNLSELDNKNWGSNCISYGISQLRAFIEATTNFYPFGKYTLPLIDLGALIKAKQELKVRKTEEQKPEQRRKIIVKKPMPKPGK